MFPNAKTCKLQLQAGINVRWLDVNMTTQEKLHAKLCSFDDDTVVLGSSNFTHNGFAVNHEADVEIQSKGVGNAFEGFFDDAFNNRSLKRAPDVPDWEEKAPTDSPADQVAQKLVGYFKDNYIPGDRSRWNDDLKTALKSATQGGGNLKNIPSVDLDALTHYIQAGPHTTKDDAATLQQKVKFIGDLAGYLTADTSSYHLDPVPGSNDPMWKARLDIAHKAGDDLHNQVPHMIQFMLDSVQAPGHQGARQGSL